MDMLLPAADLVMELFTIAYYPAIVLRATEVAHITVLYTTVN
jgi:hypothetical protein